MTYLHLSLLIGIFIGVFGVLDHWPAWAIVLSTVLASNLAVIVLGYMEKKGEDHTDAQ